MCGIVGILSHATDGQRHSEQIARALSVLHHRGPDRRSIWVAADGRVALGHARLGLVGLGDTGNQPIHAPASGRAIVVNGEFYGYEDIRRELRQRGHQFNTASDSEVLLPLYDERGTEALDSLRGEFAFLLWDPQRNVMFAARDRFGVKPLFFSVHAGCLYFASEVKALFAMGVPARWDQQSVFDYHQTWFLPPHKTLYEGVLQIPPGHYMIAELGSKLLQPSIKSYWDSDFPLAGQSSGTDTEKSILDVRAGLDDAIKMRLRADVPVACYLSGGIDSCAVLAMATGHSKQPMHSFTVAFADAGESAYDESRTASKVAKALGAVHHEVRLGSSDLAEHLGEALWHAELPFVNTNGVAKFLLSRAVRDAGFRAVLTGEGADEIFGGYLHFRRDALFGQNAPGAALRLEQLAAANPLSRPLMHATQTPPALRELEHKLGFLPSFLLAHGQGTARLQAFLRSEFRSLHQGGDSWLTWLEQSDVPRQTKGRDRLNQALYIWSKTMFPLYLLTVLGDRMEMAHSVEARLPYLDHHLVEKVLPLPVDLKVAPDLTEKWILREATRLYLPDAIYRAQKHPFLAPPAATAPGSALFELLSDTCRSTSFAASPFYHQPTVVGLLDALPGMTHEQQAQADVLLTNILSFTLLQQKLSIGS